MEKYPSEVIKAIEDYQKHYLKIKYGPNFENKLDAIFPAQEELFNFVEKSLEEEFPNNLDSRFEFEALLKNEMLKDITNLTKFESPSHKYLVNLAESIFKDAIKDNIVEEIPYSASLPSNDIQAEICEFDGIKKPIIFFHGNIFVANLLFSKLYAQLVPYDVKKSCIYLDEKKVLERLPHVRPRIIDFYKTFLAEPKTKTDQYQLNSIFENNILSELLESIELFIYSHEVGHASNNHFERYDKKTDGEKQHDEHVADQYALQRIINCYRKKEDPTGFTLIGPILFFKYLILLEKTNPKMAEDNSHPKAEERLSYYYIQLFNFINDYEEQKIKNIISFINYISSVILNEMIKFKHGEEKK